MVFERVGVKSEVTRNWLSFSEELTSMLASKSPQEPSQRPRVESLTCSGAPCRAGDLRGDSKESDRNGIADVIHQ